MLSSNSTRCTAVAEGLSQARRSVLSAIAVQQFARIDLDEGVSGSDRRGRQRWMQISRRDRGAADASLYVRFPVERAVDEKVSAVLWLPTAQRRSPQRQVAARSAAGFQTLPGLSGDLYTCHRY